MIDVENLVLERPWGRVLHDVSFVARAGVATAVVGPPASGKTALLRCIAGLEPPQGGRVRLAGVDPLRDPRGAHARLGYVGRGFGLYAKLSVRRSLEHAARMHGVAAPDAGEAVRRWAERLRLSEALDWPAGELGEAARLRLALAQAVVHGPRALLLDEPMTGLKPPARVEIAGYIARFAAEGMTVLACAPKLSVLEGGCTDLLELAGGCVIGAGVQRDAARAPPPTAAATPDAATEPNG